MNGGLIIDFQIELLEPVHEIVLRHSTRLESAALSCQRQLFGPAWTRANKKPSYPLPPTV